MAERSVPPLPEGLRCNGQATSSEVVNSNGTVAIASPRRLEEGPVDFARVPLLHTRPRSDDWRRWLDYAGFLAVPVRGGSTFESASQTADAVAADLGLGIAIDCLLGPDLFSGRVAIAHTARRPTRGHFTLQYDARFAADPSLIAFADWLTDVLDVDRSYSSQ